MSRRGWAAGLLFVRNHPDESLATHPRGAEIVKARKNVIDSLVWGCLPLMVSEQGMTPQRRRSERGPEQRGRRKAGDSQGRGRVN